MSSSTTCCGDAYYPGFIFRTSLQPDRRVKQPTSQQSSDFRRQSLSLHYEYTGVFAMPKQNVPVSYSKKNSIRDARIPQPWEIFSTP